MDGSYSPDAVQQTVLDAANQYGLDPNIFTRQLQQESGLQQYDKTGGIKTSSAGAQGIAQLMPDTADTLGVDPTDWKQNIFGGAKYMRQMLDRYQGNYEHALMAYNAGPKRVDAYVNNGVPLPKETQNYVPAIMGGALTPQTNQGSPMPQDDNSGALTLTKQLGGGILSGNGGLNGLGPALQDAGSYLMSTSPYTKPGSTDHVQKYLQSIRPQIVDGGTDLFGKKILYTFSPTKGLQRINPQAATPQGTPSTAASNTDAVSPEGDNLTQDKFMGLIRQYQAGKINKDDLMNQTGMIGLYADSLAKGTADPRMLGTRASMLRGPAIVLAKVLNPSMPFDENAIAGRQAYNRLMATGSSDPSKLPGAIASASKMTEHALQTAQASLELHGQQMFPENSTANEIENWIKARGSDNKYKGALNNLNTIADIYSGEQNRLATGGRPTLTGHEHTARGLSADKSHAERMRSLASSLDAALAPLDQMVTNHNALFGENKTVMDMFNPETRNNLAKVRQLIAGAQTQGAPQPQTAAPEIRYQNGQAYVRGPNGEAVPYKP